MGVNLAVQCDLKDAPATFLQLDFIHVIADILDEKGLGLLLAPHRERGSVKADGDCLFGPSRVASATTVQNVDFPWHVC